MATMAMLRPAAVAAFNTLIMDEFARTVFDNTFELWLDSRSKYAPDNSAFRNVIYDYIIPIRRELDIMSALYDTVPTSRIVTTHNDDENGTDNRSGRSSREINTGERKQLAIVYPDGYTGAEDVGYKRGETQDAADTQSEDMTSADMSETSRTRSGESSEQRFDELERAKLRAEHRANVVKLIQRCVFSFVDNRDERWEWL